MTILATDDFNRANDPTGLGANWTNNDVGAFYTVTGSQAQVTSIVPVLHRYTAISWPNDQYAKVTLTTLTAASDEGPGPACRLSAVEQTGYIVQANTTEIKLYQVAQGSFTQLGSDAAAAATNDVLELICSGTSLSVKKNGATIIGPLADSPGIAAGSAGLWGFQASATVTVDNFEGGDLEAVQEEEEAHQGRRVLAVP